MTYAPIDWDPAGLLVPLGLLHPTGFPIGIDTAALQLAANGKG